MSRPVCGNCFCTYDDDGTCGCPDDQAHYKKVIDDVQALFEAKREQAATTREDWGTGPHECHSLSAERPAQQQEPVAWLYESPMPDGSIFVGASAERLTIGVGVTPDTKETPLYTSPPASKPWVEIAPEELLEAANQQGVPKAFAAGAAWANAKLLEKNA